nr:hypothetical protein [Tanacetum cinerariifolium]
MVAWRWGGSRDGDGSGGCGVETKVVAARGGEWCGGSSRSGWEECFWGSPEKFSGGGGGGRSVVVGGRRGGEYYCCSEGSLGDKIICDLDKTPDLSQRSLQNCPKYGNPVDDSSEPSNDNTNVVNAIQEPFVVEQDPDILKKICSNPLFDEEIISMKIDPHHFNAESGLIESLLNHDSPIISSSLKIDSLFDKFAGELTLLKSILPGIDETNCDPEDETRFIKRLLYDNSSPRPPEEFIFENSDTAFESFSPSPIPVEDSDSLMEEIDLSFTPDYPINDSLSLSENDSFHFDIPSSSRPPVKPPDSNSGILNVKMIGDISEHKVPMPRLMSTLVPNQEKSPNLSSHLGYEAFQPSTECPMMIYGKNTPILDVLFFHFYPP